MDPEPIDADFAGKKKKKKEKAVVFDEEPKNQNEQPTETAAADDDVLDFSKIKKKKKTKEKTVKLTDEEATTAAAQEISSPDNVCPDYTYDELLARVYNIMREKNPGFDAGEKKKFVMRPPNIGKAGSKKTAFSNFAEICTLLKRTPKHLLTFLLAELGTSGSIDGSNQLIIKGRFQQKHIENVLRKYIKEYVTCHTCRSASTELMKDTRLFFLQCKECGSRCSVASIKTGFQAQTTKRSVMRNAAAQQ